MSNSNQSEEMSKSWKDRLVSALIGAVICVVPVLISTAMTRKYDKEKTVVEKIQELETEKANITYVDKQIGDVKKEHDDQYKALHDQLDIVVRWVESNH